MRTMSSRGRRDGRRKSRSCRLCLICSVSTSSRDPIPLSELLSFVPALHFLRVLHLPSIALVNWSLVPFTSLTDLSLACYMDSAQLHWLQHLPELRVLHLRSLNGSDHAIDKIHLAALSNCTRLECLTIRWFGLSQLPLVVTARMQQLHSLTLIGPGVPTEQSWWSRCLNSPPKLRSFRVVLSRGSSDLIAAIAAAVDPTGPLRYLLLHPEPATPQSVVDLVESTRLLMRNLPLLQRFDLSLSQPRAAPSRSSAPESDAQPDFTERCLDVNLIWTTEAEVLRRIEHNRSAAVAAAGVDPRVTVVVAPIVVQHTEREWQLRERWRAPPQKSARCAVM